MYCAKINGNNCFQYNSIDKFQTYQNFGKIFVNLGDAISGDENLFRYTGYGGLVQNLEGRVCGYITPLLRSNITRHDLFTQKCTIHAKKCKKLSNVMILLKERYNVSKKCHFKMVTIEFNKIECA